ncbi:hypothetical protein LG272_04030 [Pseudidiomarina marina]|uniref:hypothetical protein n=1 Tax=Pseudidiomarina marina TaxID=502366 RepID=UPI00384A4DC0
MQRKQNIMWIVIAVIAALFFADEILGFVGAVIGIVFSIGFTGLLVLALAAGAFALAVFVGCSVGLALTIAVIALALSLFGWLLPYLLVGFLVYLVVRKKPNTV